MTIAYFAYTGLTNAITTFAIGTYVLIRNFSSPAARAFALLMFSIAYWCTNYFLWLTSNDYSSALFFINHTMIGVFFIPSSLTFFITQLAGEKKTFLNITNFGISFIFTVFFSFNPNYISGVERRLFFPYWPVPGILFHIMVIHFFINVIYSHIVLWKLRGEFGGTKKTQVTYFLIGTAIGFFGGCTNYFLWYNIPIPPVLNFCVSIYAVMVAYAVFRHRLLEPEEVLAIHRDKLALVGLLSSSINHEIKNPLFMLQEYANKLAREPGNPDVLSKMTAQIGRISRIVERLSEFGRPNPNPDNEEEVDIAQTIDGALFFATQELKYRNIEIVKQIDPALPKIKGHKSQFEEIFLNLFVNAYHAMPEGGKLTIEGRLVPFVTLSRAKGLRTLSARSFAGAQDDSCVQIVIADTGTGIPRDQLKDIFKPFYTTKQKSGTGLGLYIVKMLVEQNKGTIEVESVQNQGTTFRIKLKNYNEK